MIWAVAMVGMGTVAVAWVMVRRRRKAAENR